MIWLWIGFILFVFLMLALDLGVFHRKAHTISVREALIWSGVWISLALLFNVFVYFAYDHHILGIGQMPDGSVRIDPVDGIPLNGHNAAIKFFTGYVIEKSLSVDNIFVIALVFAFFKIPNIYQHRVLFWGILGALLMRGIFIAVGAVLIAKFHWILYVFGVILILTAGKMLFGGGEPDPQANPLIRLARRLFPITHELHGAHFVVRGSDLSPREEIEVPSEEGDMTAREANRKHDERLRNAKWVLTPLALSLVVVESTDLIFAVDSIPAIFAITGDPFLVFTSNIFAILGLRSLYFALAGIMDKFKYLKVSLAIILALVGVKMLTAEWLKKALGEHVSLYMLGLIALILLGGIVASLIASRRQPIKPAEPPPT